MKLLSFQGDPKVLATLVAAEYNGVDIETPEFDCAKLSEVTPLGKPPVLQCESGSLFEADAILRYVGGMNRSTDLLGCTAFEQAQVDQWITFANNQLAPVANQWVYPIFDALPYNAGNIQKAKSEMKTLLQTLDAHLASRTFFVGQSVTLADIAVASALLVPFKLVLDTAFQKNHVNLTRWFSTCVNQPQFAAVLGPVKLCEKAHEAQPPKKEKPAPKEKAPAAAKPKREAKPADDDKDDEDEPEEEKPTGPHWTSLLPKSTMVMDEWKRCYSNNDTRTVAIPEFWKMLDPAGYSLWFCDYKYSSELQKVFMSCNLVSGWFQRLDRARKFAFGNVMLFGDEGKMAIKGVFLFRGQDIPEEVKAVDDFELYVWKKLDPANPADKTLVEDYWAWDGSFGGEALKLNQGKTFK